MGLQEDIQEIKKFMIEEKSGVKKKKFRYPFGKKVGKSQKKKNYVTILIVNENGTCDFKKYKIEEQTVLHDLVPRLATSEYVLFDKKGNPIIILPSWSVEPFSPRQNFNESLTNGSNKKGYSILMNRMKTETISAKKKMGNLAKWIIGLVIGGIIIYALLTSGGA
ncbi:MAG TPA: hypothetical protein ENG87_05025 [Candidatus Pacearchaeota archaeon]|nr:hypothetical protein [Candidatus Pacearchaeota archaeon]